MRLVKYFKSLVTEFLDIAVIKKMPINCGILGYYDKHNTKNNIEF